MKLILRFFSAVLSVVLFTTNVVFVHATESNFWSQRKKSQEVSGNRPIQFAGIPHSFSADFLPHVSPVRSAIKSSLLSSRLKSSLPKGSESTLIPIITALPQNVGTVRKIVASNGGDRVVIHIQDVHRNHEAQANIGKTVQELIGNNKVDLIALEGAFGPMDFSWYRAYPHQKAVKAVADYLLRENRISGPVFTAFILRLRSGQVLPPFVGIDEKNHYDANVEAYRRSAPLVSSYKNQIEKKSAELNATKTAIFNAALQKFDVHMTSYGKGLISWGDHVRFLAAYNQNSSANIKAFLTALDLEKKLNFGHVESERSRLISGLLAKLDKSETENLLNHSAAYRVGDLSHSDFYTYVEDLCVAKHLELSRFPAMREYIRYVLLSDSLDVTAILKEAAAVEKSVYASLAKTNEERQLIAASQQLALTSKLVDFSLTSEEWEEYKKIHTQIPVPLPARGGDRGGEHHPDSSFEFQNARSASTPPLPPPLAGRGTNVKDGRLVDEDLHPFESFYQEAEARDQAMAANLEKAMDASHAKVAVLVTGGFHSEGMARQLQPKGMTVISYAPKISKIEEESGSTYLSMFTQEKTPLDKLFAGEKLFLAGAPQPADTDMTHGYVGATHKAEMSADHEGAEVVKGKKLKVKVDGTGAIILLAVSVDLADRLLHLGAQASFAGSRTLQAGFMTDPVSMLIVVIALALLSALFAVPNRGPKGGPEGRVGQSEFRITRDGWEIQKRSYFPTSHTPFDTKAVAINSDATYAAFATTDRRISIINMKTNVATFVIAHGEISNLVFSGDGRTLAIVSEKRVTLVDVRSPANPRRIKAKEKIETLALNKNGTLLVWGFSNGKVESLDLTTNTRRSLLSSESVYKFQFLPNDQEIAIHHRYEVNQWRSVSPITIANPRTGKTRGQIEVRDPWDFALHPTKPIVALVDSSYVLLYDYEKAAVVRTFSGRHGLNFRNVAFDAIGERIVFDTDIGLFVGRVDQNKFDHFFGAKGDLRHMQFQVDGSLITLSDKGYLNVIHDVNNQRRFTHNASWYTGTEPEEFGSELNYPRDITWKSEADLTAERVEREKTQATKAAASHVSASAPAGNLIVEHAEKYKPIPDEIKTLDDFVRWAKANPGANVLGTQTSYAIRFGSNQSHMSRLIRLYGIKCFKKNPPQQNVKATLETLIKARNGKPLTSRMITDLAHELGLRRKDLQTVIVHHYPSMTTFVPVIPATPHDSFVLWAFDNANQILRGTTQIEIAQQYGLSQSTVSRILMDFGIVVIQVKKNSLSPAHSQTNKMADLGVIFALASLRTPNPTALLVRIGLPLILLIAIVSAALVPLMLLWKFGWDVPFLRGARRTMDNTIRFGKAYPFIYCAPFAVALIAAQELARMYSPATVGAIALGIGLPSLVVGGLFSNGFLRWIKQRADIERQKKASTAFAKTLIRVEHRLRTSSSVVGSDHVARVLSDIAGREEIHVSELMVRRVPNLLATSAAQPKARFGLMVMLSLILLASHISHADAMSKPSQLVRIDVVRNSQDVIRLKTVINTQIRAKANGLVVNPSVWALAGDLPPNVLAEAQAIVAASQGIVPVTYVVEDEDESEFTRGEDGTYDLRALFKVAGRRSGIPLFNILADPAQPVPVDVGVKIVSAEAVPYVADNHLAKSVWFVLMIGSVETVVSMTSILRVARLAARMA